MNNLTEPQHEMLVEDQRLVETTIQSLGPIAAKLSNRQFRQIYQACQELALKVRVAIERNVIASSASEAECLLPEVQFNSCPGETGTKFSTSQVTSGTEPTPETLPIKPREKTILQENGSPLSIDFAMPGAALFSWN